MNLKRFPKERLAHPARHATAFHTTPFDERHVRSCLGKYDIYPKENNIWFYVEFRLSLFLRFKKKAFSGFLARKKNWPDEIWISFDINCRQAQNPNVGSASNVSCETTFNTCEAKHILDSSCLPFCGHGRQRVEDFDCQTRLLVPYPLWQQVVGNSKDQHTASRHGRLCRQRNIQALGHGALRRRLLDEFRRIKNRKGKTMPCCELCWPTSLRTERRCMGLGFPRC